MKIKKGVLVFFLAVMLIPLTCASGFAEMDVGGYWLGGGLSVGGGFVAGPRDMNRGYLKQYIPFPDGFLADADVWLKSKDDLQYYRFMMSHPGLRDQDFLLQAGKLGVYHAEIEYDELQHLYCTVNPNNNHIGILVERLRFRGYYTPTPDIAIFAEDQFLRRVGSQPLTYVTGPGSGGYAFTSENTRPIDYKQNDMKAGVEYARPLYQLRVAYHLSTFDNAIPDVWARPISNVANTFVSLPPSNMANYITAEGGLNLPNYKTRLTSSFTYGWLSQDSVLFDRFNTSLGPAGLSASTLAADFSGVTRPSSSVTLRYAYRAYNFENNNDLSNRFIRNAFFPGDIPLMRAEQYSYLRQSVTTGAEYKVNNKMALNVGYAWQGVDRSDGQGSTSAHSPLVGLRLFPTNWLSLTANYAYTYRSGNNFLFAEPLTYKFYAGTLQRNNANIIAEVYPANDVTFSVNFSVYNDYFSNNTFGLQNDYGWSAGADVSWRPHERFALSLGYDHQQLSTKERADTTSLVTGDAGPNLTTSDAYDSIALRADVKVIPKKLDLSTRANFSFSTSSFHNGNVASPTEYFFYVSTFGTYKFNEHWACRVGYIFQYFNMTNAYQALYLTGITPTAPPAALPNQKFNTLDGYYTNATAHLLQAFLQYKF